MSGIFQDPIPIDREQPVREALPLNLNINQHTIKHTLVSVVQDTRVRGIGFPVFREVLTLKLIKVVNICFL